MHNLPPGFRLREVAFCHWKGAACHVHNKYNFHTGSPAIQSLFARYVAPHCWQVTTVAGGVLDADDWIRSKLQGTTAQLSDYLRTPQVIVVGSVEDPAASVGELTRKIMLKCGTHHMIVTRNHEDRVTHIAFYREEM